jgi:hypothetical protein
MLLHHPGRHRLVVKPASLSLARPKPDQRPPNIIAPLQGVNGGSRKMFINKLTLKRDAVLAVTGHGSLPPKTSDRGKFLNPTCPLRGAHSISKFPHPLCYARLFYLPRGEKGLRKQTA